jgi:hypothetical protein
MDADSVTKVVAEDAGRLDRVVTKVYGAPVAYKAVQVANNMLSGMGTKVGIRPRKEAYENELRAKGFSEKEIVQKMKELDPYAVTEYTWQDGQPTTGWVSECFAGRQIILPSVESINLMLSAFETTEETYEG